ncbi:MAG: serine O-acetyltransferase, partial [Crocosphaera sp.]
YQSGVRVNPLEHGNLPDSEAKVIRLLLDRIDALEQKVQELQEEKLKERALVSSGVSYSGSDADYNETQRCYLKDKEIEEFLGGTM